MGELDPKWSEYLSSLMVRRTDWAHCYKGASLIHHTINYMYVESYYQLMIISRNIVCKVVFEAANNLVQPSVQS